MGSASVGGRYEINNRAVIKKIKQDEKNESTVYWYPVTFSSRRDLLSGKDNKITSPAHTHCSFLPSGVLCAHLYIPIWKDTICTCKIILPSVLTAVKMIFSYLCEVSQRGNIVRRVLSDESVGGFYCQKTQRINFSEVLGSISVWRLTLV